MKRPKIRSYYWDVTNHLYLYASRPVSMQDGGFSVQLSLVHTDYDHTDTDHGTPRTRKPTSQR